MGFVHIVYYLYATAADICSVTDVLSAGDYLFTGKIEPMVDSVVTIIIQTFFSCSVLSLAFVLMMHCAVMLCNL